MKLNVSSKNEFYFYPDVADNLKLEEKDRFTIVVKKVSAALSGTDWFKYDEDDKYLGVDNKAKIKSQIKEIRNAPILLVDGDKEKELTIDDLMDGIYPELFEIITELNLFILKIESEGGLETKKS